ncbi:MAG: hypothetical protein ABII21_03720 [bacterium]
MNKRFQIPDSRFQSKHTSIWRLASSVCLLVSGVYLLTSIAPSARAETLESTSYRIRMGNFNITSGFKSSANYNLTDTVGQIAAEFFSSNGYHVKAGFQYIYTLYNFTFKISSLAIDLGTLAPNAFSTSSHTLTVTAPGQGYSVAAYETSRLTRVGDTETISDTTCDSGPCTETSAQVWSTPTNNGFGYNITGDDHAADFEDDTYFRPFPDFSLDEIPATVMATSSAGKNRVATVTYQLSPSGYQAAGTYATQIIYIATPVY